jgi:hypothetical protein
MRSFQLGHTQEKYRVSVRPWRSLPRLEHAPHEPFIPLIGNDLLYLWTARGGLWSVWREKDFEVISMDLFNQYPSFRFTDIVALIFYILISITQFRFGWLRK